jgi:hypothetical protein
MFCERLAFSSVAALEGSLGIDIAGVALQVSDDRDDVDSHRTKGLEAAEVSSVDLTKAYTGCILDSDQLDSQCDARTWAHGLVDGKVFWT